MLFSSSRAALAVLLSSSLLSLSSAQEVGETIFLTGFLADMLCGRLEVAPDTANMIASPVDHTVGCTLLPACLRSGYGLLQDIGTNGNPTYRVAAIFDEAANDYLVDNVLRVMDNGINDLRVQMQGVVMGTQNEGPIQVSAIGEVITDAQGVPVWAGMNNVPVVTLESLRFCNYQGPDAVPVPRDDEALCNDTNQILDLVGDQDMNRMATANLCMANDISLLYLDADSSTQEYFLLTPTGCADHATFQDVRRADTATCAAASDETCDGCTSGGGDDMCEMQCLDACSNPLRGTNGQGVAMSCCLDGCGNAMYNSATGTPWLDICGNPVLADGVTPCPAEQIGENQINQCIDACGSILTDACGSPYTQCCLDVCGSALYDTSTGMPWVDACGNPAANAAGDACAILGVNTCLPSDNNDASCAEQCDTQCLDACGNPLSSSICCLDPCGNALYDSTTGVAYVDVCGSPTLADGTACPADRIGENNCEKECSTECLDGCGNPLNTALCCLDGCGNALYNPATGMAYVDGCGSPTLADGTACPANQVGENSCEDGGWRRLVASWDSSISTKRTRQAMIASHQKIVQAKWPKKTQRAIAMYNRNRRSLRRELAGHEMTPAAGQGSTCSEQCINACGGPLIDVCGNPVSECCLDACGNALYDTSNGTPWVDVCGNPLTSQNGPICPEDQLGFTDLDCGECSQQCVDVCGNPLALPSGRTVSSCCLDGCGSPIVDGCGVPYFDACGSPLTGDMGAICPEESLGFNDVNECIDACGSPLVDACGSPLTECCLDGCGSPILDVCGNPYTDPCGSPASDMAGTTCMAANIGRNSCLDGGNDEGTCAPLFPPAGDSFQCEGLVSACTLAQDASLTDGSDGVPESIPIGRRLSTRRINGRRMQIEPSVPLYTPIKKDLRFKIPKTPTATRTPTPLDPAHEGVIGVAVNGVPIVYEHPGEGSNTLLFDSCGGHGDLSNRYHYHLPPVCLLRSLGGTVPRASDWWLAPNAETQWPSEAFPHGNRSPLVGWAIDGHPIFGPYNPDNGELVIPSGGSGSEECAENVLDECNGMLLENGVYAYFMTATAPFVPPCLMGEVASDAFVDGGALDGAVETCPFEGTNPLAGTEICDEKTIIFSDQSCPSNADRQDIRSCFDFATSSFYGEPTCAQMQAAIDESMPCFLSAGCCVDLEETIAEWKSLYPALEECTFPESDCLVFGDDNVVAITVDFATGIIDMTPDFRGSLKRSMATTLDVSLTSVNIARVTGTNTTSTVTFDIAYPSAGEAAAARAALDEDAISASLAEATGFPVASLTSEHRVPLEIDDEVWSAKQRAGLFLSLAAVLVVGGILVFMEDFASHSSSHAPEKEKELSLSGGEEPDKVKEEGV